MGRHHGGYNCHDVPCSFKLSSNLQFNQKMGICPSFIILLDTCSESWSRTSIHSTGKTFLGGQGACIFFFSRNQMLISVYSSVFFKGCTENEYSNYNIQPLF